jgi:hypothetical protein
MVGPAIASLLISVIGPGGPSVFKGVSCAMLVFCAARAMEISRQVQAA